MNGRRMGFEDRRCRNVSYLQNHQSNMKQITEHRLVWAASRELFRCRLPAELLKSLRQSDVACWYLRSGFFRLYPTVLMPWIVKSGAICHEKAHSFTHCDSEGSWTHWGLEGGWRVAGVHLRVVRGQVSGPSQRSLSHCCQFTAWADWGCTRASPNTKQSHLFCDI